MEGHWLHAAHLFAGGDHDHLAQHGLVELLSPGFLADGKDATANSVLRSRRSRAHRYVRLVIDWWAITGQNRRPTPDKPPGLRVLPLGNQTDICRFGRTFYDRSASRNATRYN